MEFGWGGMSGRDAKKKTDKLRATREKAALVFQKYLRGKRCRVAFLAVRRAAVIVQKIFRRQQAAKQAREQQEHVRGGERGKGREKRGRGEKLCCLCGPDRWMWMLG